MGSSFCNLLLWIPLLRNLCCGICCCVFVVESFVAEFVLWNLCCGIFVLDFLCGISRCGICVV